MKLIKIIKDIISPKKCYSCNQEGHFLCLKCLQSFVNYKPYCYVCKSYNNNFLVHKYCKKDIFYNKIIILSHYKNKVIKKLIKDSKYYNKKDILEDFGIYLGKLFLKNEKIINKQNYLIISVPMYFSRKFSRGYNHSEVLARYIGKITGIKANNKIIKRIKNTRQQSKLLKQERLVNLENAFKINKKHLDILDKKNIILVDDIVSTGTTLNEISKLLKKYGVKKIIGLAIASN